MAGKNNPPPNPQTKRPRAPPPPPPHESPPMAGKNDPPSNPESKRPGTTDPAAESSVSYWHPNETTTAPPPGGEHRPDPEPPADRGRDESLTEPEAPEHPT